MAGMAEHPTPDELRDLLAFLALEAAEGADDGGKRSAMLRQMVALMRDYKRAGGAKVGRYDGEHVTREVHARWSAVYGALVTHVDRFLARKATRAEIVSDMRARFGEDVGFAFEHAEDTPGYNFNPDMLEGGTDGAAFKIVHKLMKDSKVKGRARGLVPELWRRYKEAADRDARGEVLTEPDAIFMAEVERHLRGEAPAGPGEPFALLRNLTRLFPDLPPVHLFAHLVRSNPGPLPADPEGLMRLLALVTEPDGPGSRRFVQRSG